MPNPVTGLASCWAAGAVFSAGGAEGAAAAAGAGAAFSSGFFFGGNVTVLVSSAPSSSWATSSTSTPSPLPDSCRSVKPSVIITRQNGQPVAIFAPFDTVINASSTRSWFTRLPMCSSIHIRAPPAPQHRPVSACRGISFSVTPDAPISSRGAS